MLWCVLCIFSSHRPSDALYSSHRLLSLSHFSSVASRHRLCQYMKHRAQCASSSTYRQRDSALGTSARTRQSSQSSTSQTRRVMTRRDQSQVTLICHPQTLQRFQHSSPVSSFPLSLRLKHRARDIYFSSAMRLVAKYPYRTPQSSPWATQDAAHPHQGTKAIY